MIIIVEPEIGENVQLYSYPFMQKNNLNYFFVKQIEDKITEKKNNLFLIDKKWYELFRIYAYKFGGIWLHNSEYDTQKIYNDNIIYLKKTFNMNIYDINISVI